MKVGNIQVLFQYHIHMYNKAIKNRPQKAWAGLAYARLLLRRYAFWGVKS